MASMVNGSEREDRPSAQQSLTVSFLKLFPCRWQPWRVILNEIFSSLDKTEGATSIFHLTSLFVYSGNQTGSLKTMNCQFLLKKSHCLAVYILQIWSGAHNPCHPAKIPFLFSSGVVESREFLFIFQSGDKNEDHSGPPTICPVRPRTSVFYELLQSAFVVRSVEGGREMHSLRMLPWEAGPFGRGKLAADNVKRNSLDSIVIPWVINTTSACIGCLIDNNK